MSLLDALLLDPLRVNYFLALRTDGCAGTGSQAEPWNASMLSTPVFAVSGISRAGRGGGTRVTHWMFVGNLDRTHRVELVEWHITAFDAGNGAEQWI